MMQTHHPLGAGSLCGAQLRYLIENSAGVLGELSFSAAAWRLVERDRWIGGDDASRAAGLAKIVANSRFLILPTVNVPNLASHVLSAATSRLAADRQTPYGIRPVLVETFVDGTRYRGTCSRAANWIALGQTQGRGGQDRSHSATGVPKDIWAFPLQPDWKSHLCAGHVVAASPPCPRMPATDWGKKGLAVANSMRDSRDACLPSPGISTQDPRPMCRRHAEAPAKTKAAYRFLDHDDTSMDSLLQPHYQATEEGHLMSDHVHMMIGIPPQYAVSQVVGSRVHQGEKRDSPGPCLRRAQAKLRGAALLDAGILRVHGWARRGSHSGVHP